LEPLTLHLMWSDRGSTH